METVSGQTAPEAEATRGQGRATFSPYCLPRTLHAGTYKQAQTQRARKPTSAGSFLKRHFFPDGTNLNCFPLYFFLDLYYDLL